MLNNPIISTVPTLHQPLHSKVSNYLNDQRRTGQCCDLILELENEIGNTVFGHFCVVSAQSQFIGGSHFLQKSLQFSIHNPLKVTIKNFNCSLCLQTIMDFFYEDIVSIPNEHEEHFKKLSKMLAVTELTRLFEGQDGSNELPSSINSNLADVDNIDKKEDSCRYITNDTDFDDHQNYFKLKNLRTHNVSSKINYCIACDFKCYRVQEMISHMSSCEASHLTCSLCELGFLGWREYDAHLRKHSSDIKKPFFCLECDARFITRASLMIHNPKHSTEAPHLCPHCGKGFKWKQGLSSHLLIHNNEKPMLCDVCGYCTTNMKALKSHKLRHTGEYFKCTFSGCNHRANRKENLKLHIETHKQERPFVCEVCGCKFSQNKNLKRHALKHAPEEIKKYKCQLCSFSSHRSDKLKEHIQRVHTEKAVQLELPEIVENAFENGNDEFKLPVVPVRKSTKKSYKKTKIKIVTQRRLKPLAPKPTEVYL